jgi:myo-inositol-1(or 4)-monophosphatase
VRELLETAMNAARAGGAVLQAMAADMGEVRTKSATNDLVTDADVASGVAVVHEVLERYPSARFVIEEDEVHECTVAPRGLLGDEEVWIVDPLDGTTSFVHGYPTYSVAVACLRAGQPVVGAVYNAAADEMNAAAVGMGATRDGNPLRVTDVADIREALFITGFPYDRGATLDVQMRALTAFLRAPVHGIRRDGSAAIDCCHVAGGRADGFWEFGLKPWDTAAGVVILREAGAAVSDVDGNPWTTASGSMCCANPELHERMLEVIAASRESA